MDNDCYLSTAYFDTVRFVPSPLSFNWIEMSFIAKFIMVVETTFHFSVVWIISLLAEKKDQPKW